MIRLRLIPTPGFHQEDGVFWFKKVAELLGSKIIEVTSIPSSAAVFQSEEEARRVLGSRYDEFVIEHIS